jgi:hypothetical protein
MGGAVRGAAGITSVPLDGTVVPYTVCAVTDNLPIVMLILP